MPLKRIKNDNLELTIVMTRMFPIKPTIMTIPKTTGTNRLVNIFNSSFQSLVLFSEKPCMMLVLDRKL